MPNLDVARCAVAIAIGLASPRSLAGEMGRSPDAVLRRFPDDRTVNPSQGERNMSDTMTNADLVRRGHQAFNEADIDTIMRLWRDDVTWTTPGESTVAGTARGKEAVIAQYGRYGRRDERDLPGPAAERLRSRGRPGRRPAPQRRRTQRQATRHDVLHRVRDRGRPRSSPASSTSSTCTTGTSSGPDQPAAVWEPARRRLPQPCPGQSTGSSGTSACQPRSPHPGPPARRRSPRMKRPAPRARPIPLGEEGLLGAAGLAPTAPMAHRRMTGRHRLAVHPNLLPHPARHARLRIGELHAFGPHPTPPTGDPSLAIDQRRRVRGPRQVIPDPIARRPHAAGATAAAAARIPRRPLPLNTDPHAPRRVRAVPAPLDHPESWQARDPRKILPRSHASSLAAQQESTPPGSPVPSGIALRRPGRRADRPPQERPAQAAGDPRRGCRLCRLMRTKCGLSLSVRSHGGADEDQSNRRGCDRPCKFHDPVFPPRSAGAVRRWHGDFTADRLSYCLLAGPRRPCRTQGRFITWALRKWRYRFGRERSRRSNSRN